MNQNLDKSSKKKNTGLIIGIVVAVVVIGAVFSSKFLLSKNKNETKDNNISYNQQYLDASRNLKSEYDFKEIFDSYTIMLNDKKSYIIKSNDNYHINSIGLSQGFFNGMSGFYKNGEGKWIASFNIITLNNSTLLEVKDKITSDGYYNIIEETSKYILSTNGKDYVYNFFMDDIIFEVQLSTYDNSLKNDDVISIIKNIKSIVKEDDMKEPYLVDKIINVKLNNGYKIKSYLIIDYINNDIMNDTNYSVSLSSAEDNGDDSILDIYYLTQRIINNYNLKTQVNENPKVYYDQNQNSFIITENNINQIFKIRKSNIDGDNIEIKTYKQFVDSVKTFFE